MYVTGDGYTGEYGFEVNLYLFFKISPTSLIYISISPVQLCQILALYK